MLKRSLQALGTLAWLSSLLLLAACGRGSNIDLNLDQSQAELSGMFNKQNPVGILEVRDAKADKNPSFGIQVGLVDHSKNVYCTAFLSEKGTIITSGECLDSSGGKKADPGKMTLFMRRPGQANTSAIAILSVMDYQKDSAQNWAILEPAHYNALVAEFGTLPLRNSTPDAKTLSAKLPAKMIVVDSPNGSGVAHLRIVNAKINTVDAIGDLETIIGGAYATKSSIPATIQQLTQKSVQSCIPEHFYGSLQIPLDELGGAAGMSGAPLIYGGQVMGISFTPGQFSGTSAVAPQSTGTDTNSDSSTATTGAPKASSPAFCQWLPSLPSSDPKLQAPTPQPICSGQDTSAGTK